MNVELFYCAESFFLSSAFVFWCFSEGHGKCSDVQMFHFVISFIFKNLCTVFYKIIIKKKIVFTGFRMRRGKEIHSCAILSRCCSVVFLPVQFLTNRGRCSTLFASPLFSLSVTDQTRSGCMLFVLQGCWFSKSNTACLRGQ